MPSKPFTKNRSIVQNIEIRLLRFIFYLQRLSFIVRLIADKVLKPNRRWKRPLILQSHVYSGSSSFFSGHKGMI